MVPSAPRSSASTCSRLDRSPFSGIVPILEQPSDPHPAVDRLVVLEAQRRGVLQAQLRGDSTLQIAVARTEPLKGGLAYALVAEHAHVNACVAQVWACLDSRNCHETNAGILQIRSDCGAED